MDEIYFHQPRQPVFNDHDEMHYKAQTTPEKKKVNSKRNIIACTVAIILAIFLVGLGLGFWTCNLQKTVDSAEITSDSKKKKLVVSPEDIAAQIDRKNIEKHLRLV